MTTATAVSNATTPNTSPAGIARHAGSHSTMSASLLMPKTRLTMPVPSGVSSVATPASPAHSASDRARARSQTNAVTSTAATTTPPTTTAPWRFAQSRNTSGSHANRARASSVTVTTSSSRLNT